MKAILLPALLSFVLSTVSPAQTCREVVRDGAGRVVQTVDRQKQAGGTERAVIRDASGRVTGTESSHGSGTMSTTRRDASGRYSGNTAGNGTCAVGTRVPVPSTGARK